MSVASCCSWGFVLNRAYKAGRISPLLSSSHSSSGYPACFLPSIYEGFHLVAAPARAASHGSAQVCPPLGRPPVPPPLLCSFFLPFPVSPPSRSPVFTPWLSLVALNPVVICGYFRSFPVTIVYGAGNSVCVYHGILPTACLVHTKPPRYLKDD